MNGAAGHSVVAHPSTIVGGFVVPSAPPGPETSGSELVRFHRERLREREPDAVIHTLYLPDQAGIHNTIVGVQRLGVDDVPVGDVFAYVPSGAFAVFSPMLSLPDPVEDLWSQFDDAVADGLVERAHGPEFELFWPSGRIELHVSIVLR